MQAADYFRQLPLFSDLGPEEIVDVLRIARVVSFKAGQKLCTRGEQGNCAFLIEHGEASVRVAGEASSEVEVARVGRGEILGELALVDGHPRSADVVAITDVRGYRIDRSEFDAMRRAMHPAAFKMLRRIAITVSDRLRDINDAIAHELTGSGSADAAAAAAATAAVARANEAGRGSRAAQRASREIERVTLPDGVPKAGKPARPRARRQAPASSFWRGMLDRLRGGTWK